MDVIVDVDIKRHRTAVWSEVYKFLNINDVDYSLELAGSHITFNDFDHKLSKKADENTIVLGRDLSQDFYLKPIKKVFTSQHVISSNNLIEHEIDKLHILDEKLFALWKVLNLSRILKPTNYLEQLDNFITYNGHYNPKFEYNRPSDKKLASVHRQIKKLQENYFDYAHGLKSGFANLFLDKANELIHKHDLVLAYKHQNYDEILLANQKLFGTLNQDLIKKSKLMIFEHQNDDVKLGRTLRSLEIREYVLSYLKQQWYTWVEVFFDTNTTARLTIFRNSKKIVVKILQWVQFKEKDLQATLAHEVDVHIRRRKNGLLSWWHILRNGTAHFLAHEEWLAVLEWNTKLPAEYVKKWMYYKYYLLDIAGKNDFAYIAGVYRSLRWYTLRWAFQWTLRVKKWIQDTWLINPGSVYLKEKVYLDGYTDINNWIAWWGNKEDLMVGKVKVGDLDYV